MHVELDPPPCILDIFCLNFQLILSVRIFKSLTALLLLILTLTEPPNMWKSEYFGSLYTVDLFTHFKARPISQTSWFDIPS